MAPAQEQQQQQEGTPATPEAKATQVGGVERVEFQGDVEGQSKIEGDKNSQKDGAPALESDIPGGYESWEAYGKAVQAGEINPDGSKVEEAPAEDGEGAGAELTEEQRTLVDDQLKELPEEAREKAKPFFEEFARAGTLSDASKEAAAKAFGVTPEMVDLYIKGAQAGAQESMASVLEQAGVSEEEALGFQAWANENWTDEQRIAFNAKPQAEAYKEAVAEWKAAGNGPAPRDITKGERPEKAGNNTGPEPYANRAQMVADMNDPRYAKDSAFRASVEARVGVSTF